MVGRNLTLAVLRTLDRQLQGLAGFVHRQVQQVEKRREPAPPDPDPAPSEEGGPPAHWLERVRQAAPGFLDAPSGQSFRAASETRPGPAITEVPAPDEKLPPASESAGSRFFRFRERTKKSPELTTNTGSSPKYQAGAEETEPLDFKDSRENFSGGESLAGPLEKVKTETGPRQHRQHDSRARISFPKSVSEKDRTSFEQPPVSSDRHNLSEKPLNSLNSFSESLETPPRKKETRPDPQTPASSSSEARSETKGSREKVEKAESLAAGRTDQEKRITDYPARRKTTFAPVSYRTSQPDVNVAGDFYSRQPGQDINFSNKTESKRPRNPMAKANLALERYLPQSGDSAAAGDIKPGRKWTKPEKLPAGENFFSKPPLQEGLDRERPVGEERRWPELPEDEPVESNNWPQIQREMEHLRRLEEEQRGTYGTGRLFD